MESLTAPKGKGNTRVRMDLLCNECDRPGVLARGLCPTHYSYWHRSTKGRKVTTHTKTCAFCAKVFEASMQKTAYCSEGCAQRDRAGWSKSKEIAKWNPPKALAITSPQENSRTFVAGTCRICATSFVSTQYMVTCSPECSQLRAREYLYLKTAKRRALKRDAFVAPVYRKKVFEADGYRCHICRKLTKRDAVVPHPKAPTIDHLIPLSLGGTHEPSNCRTACFLCNSIKSDRIAGDQLILFNY